MTAAGFVYDLDRGFASVFGGRRGITVEQQTARESLGPVLFTHQGRSMMKVWQTLTVHRDYVVIRNAGSRRARKHFQEVAGPLPAAELVALVQSPPYCVTASHQLRGGVRLSIVEWAQPATRGTAKRSSRFSLRLAGLQDSVEFDFDERVRDWILQDLGAT